MNQLLWMVAIVSMALPVSSNAQECNSQIAPTTPTNAFTINGDDTVTDNRTGLIWDHCAWGLTGADCSGGYATNYKWPNALAQAVAANNANYKGYSDWRLPNVKELVSIVERSCYNPAMNPTLFPNAPTYLWSSSPHANSSLTSNSKFLWYLNVRYGNYNLFSSEDNNYAQVLLVRGG